jgi:hypothetical protein
MAVTAIMFTQFANQMATKTVTMGTDALRVIAATNITGLAAVQDTAATMTAVKAATSWTEVANAAGSSNYVNNANSHLSGLGLGAGTWTRSAHVWTLTTATTIQWTTAGAGFAPTGLVFFDDIGTTDATNFPICWIDLGGAQAGTGGNWTYTLPAGGIFQATSS